MEDVHNGRRPQWKTTSMKVDLNGRQHQGSLTGSRWHQLTLLANLLLSLAQLSPSLFIRFNSLQSIKYYLNLNLGSSDNLKKCLTDMPFPREQAPVPGGHVPKMPWMTVSRPSLGSVFSRQTSPLLQHLSAQVPPQHLTSGEMTRLELANTARWV